MHHTVRTAHARETRDPPRADRAASDDVRSVTTDVREYRDVLSCVQECRGVAHADATTVSSSLSIHVYISAHNVWWRVWLPCLVFFRGLGEREKTIHELLPVH